MKFARLQEFCSTADAHTPLEDIRRHLPKALRQTPQFFESDEKSLDKLDQVAWGIVKKKLSSRTLKHPLRGWAQYDETLAEVRGFCCLLDSGYTEVSFIPEANDLKTPDIRAKNCNGRICLLESKRIGFSDDESRHILENTRRIGTTETLIVRDVPQKVPIELKDKIKKTIVSAKKQLFDYLPEETSIEMIIYLTVHLDILILLNTNNSKEMTNFICDLIHEESEVSIKIDSLSSI